MMQPVSLRLMRTDDHAALMTLWQEADGVLLRETDTPEAFARFLARNPDTSFVAVTDQMIAGSIMAGQDGWRGYLYHVAVRPEWRRRGVGTRLVDAAVMAVRRYSVPKIHCLVKRDNAAAQRFWHARGFVQRNDVLDYAL